MGDAPLGVWIIILIIIANALYKAYKASEAKRQEENLKYTHPQVYAQLKQMEHERQIMAHDEKRMTHEKMQKGAGILADVFRIFRK